VIVFGWLLLERWLSMRQVEAKGNPRRLGLRNFLHQAIGGA
jgi:hypothetical protein